MPESIHECFTDREIDSLPSRIPNPMEACVPFREKEDQTAEILATAFLSPDVSWEELPSLIHLWATWKGWYQTERSEKLFCLLFRSEVFEAFEEWRAGRMETWFTTDKKGYQKPEGYWIEIADVAIRVLDYCGHMGFDVTATDLAQIHDNQPGSQGDVFVMDNMKTHEDALWLLESVCFTPHRCLRNVLFACKSYCERNGQDLKELIMQKMQYNIMREQRHGGKQA